MNNYDIDLARKRAEQWRYEAARAETADMRVFCVVEAARCEQIVRSLETGDDLWTPDPIVEVFKGFIGSSAMVASVAASE